MMNYVIVFSLISTVAFAAPTKESSFESKSLIEDVFDVYASCGAEEALSVCLKMKALRFVDRAARFADITVFDGVRIVKADDAVISRADNARALNDIEANLPVEVEAREAAVDEALVERASRFLATHTLELSMPEEGSRSLEEARGKKKKVLKSLMPLLLLLKVKAIFLIPILLGGLALLAFKALVIGKIALIISGVLALQKLLANKGQQSYEVVAHPAPHHDEHEHGWGRSAVPAAELAYNAYKPTN